MNVNIAMKELAEFIRMKEELESIVEGLKDELKKYMDTNGLDVLIGEEHKVIYKESTTSKIDITALRNVLPDIAVEFTRKTVIKRFLFT